MLENIVPSSTMPLNFFTELGALLPSHWRTLCLCYYFRELGAILPHLENSMSSSTVFGIHFTVMGAMLPPPPPTGGHSIFIYHAFGMFTELGAMLPHAGGHYAFVHHAFGAPLAFSTVWADLTINTPAVQVILGRAGGTYLISYADPLCGVTPAIINCISMFTICNIFY